MAGPAIKFPCSRCRHYKTRRGGSECRKRLIFRLRTDPACEWFELTGKATAHTILKPKIHSNGVQLVETTDKN